MPKEAMCPIITHSTAIPYSCHSPVGSHRRALALLMTAHRKEAHTQCSLHT